MPIIQGILQTSSSSNSSNPNAPQEGTTTVSTGVLAFEDDNGQYIDNNNNEIDPSTYTDYQIRNIYEKDLHIYQIGTTRPTQSEFTTAFVKLCSSTLTWICDWTACRQGQQPNIPNPDPQDSKWILLDHFHDVPKLELGPDGVSPIYRITGTYIYGNTQPDSTNLIELINFPRPPWMQDSFSRVVSASSLEYNLSTANGSTQGNKPIQPNLTGFIS